MKLGVVMVSVPQRKRIFGFTVIELMVTLAVAVILAMLAMPSFFSFRQRSALRGGSEQVLSFWNQARFEAAKRNQMVKVGVRTSGTNFCLGAATTTDPAATTVCDCFSTAAGSSACDVARFPEDQGQWGGVTYVVVSGTTPTLGGGNAVAVLEPKRGSLATPSQAGLITLAGPPGKNEYKLNMTIDALGRAVLCESDSAGSKMSDYLTRRCAP
jgi:prepilin-type N-terminal cleavage/methylation domain-containing protein